MKRLLTALVLVPFFLFSALYAPHWVFMAILAAVAVFCFHEYCGIAAATFPGRPEVRPGLLGFGAGLILLILPAHEGAFFALLAIAALAVSLRSADLTDCLPSAAVLVFGVAYIFGSWRCAAGLRAIDPWWLVFGLAINWVGDSFAYYGGRAFGRHKLAPRVSPGKSWEGTIASLLSAALLGPLFMYWRFPSVHIPAALVLSLLANASGQVGDLAESAIKRGAGVKDSGDTLPGHGGWLDRVDSSLFSIPVVYWLLQQPWITR
jgi:phosphatidate cytidylyltransferase